MGRGVGFTGLGDRGVVVVVKRAVEVLMEGVFETKGGKEVLRILLRV